MRRRVLLSLATVWWMASGLAADQQSQPARSEESAAPFAATQASYQIGPGDVLNVSVWKEQDFSRTVPVRPDGKISLPLLNDIAAAGLTPMQLALVVSEKLRNYVTNPQVTVIVTEVNSHRAYVLGEVVRPGVVQLFPGMRVLQALSSAGGLTQYANQKGIYVLRNDGEQVMRHRFNYKDVIRGESLADNLILKPGDTVVVP